MKRIGMALSLLLIASATVDAGWIWKKKKGDDEVPNGPRQLVAPNGVVVPAWASKRMQESPVPLYGKSWGRRPWALPLSTQATPSAVYARASGLGFGAGPTPGYTNSYGIAGNQASAPMGPDDGNGWGPPPGLRNLFMPSFFPYNTAYSGGY